MSCEHGNWPPCEACDKEAELYARIEALELERDDLRADLNTLKQTLGKLIPKYTQVRKERLLLRARIKQMEQQGPVAKMRVHRTGGNAGLAWSVAPLNDFDSLPLMRDEDRLYALPGAKGE